MTLHEALRHDLALIMASDPGFVENAVSFIPAGQGEEAATPLTAIYGELTQVAPVPGGASGHGTQSLLYVQERELPQLGRPRRQLIQKGDVFTVQGERYGVNSFRYAGYGLIIVNLCAWSGHARPGRPIPILPLAEQAKDKPEFTSGAGETKPGGGA